MGYLDNAGLSRFTAWVKGRLAGKQDALTAGDGLSIAENVASVDTPVRGIMAQADYDTLPEAERTKGLYVIPDAGGDGPGGGSSGGDGILLVNFNLSEDDSGTVDVSCSQPYQKVWDAISSGKAVIARLSFYTPYSGTLFFYTTTITATGEDCPIHILPSKSITFHFNTYVWTGNTEPSNITYQEDGTISQELISGGGA